MKVISPRELETRDCLQPLCVDVAMPGLDHCRRHASIADIRAANGDGNGLAALHAMDAGLPQAPPINTTVPRTPELKEIPMPVKTAVKLCKTPGCANEANTRYDRGPYSGLCDATCIPTARIVVSNRMKQVRADRAAREELGRAAASQEPRAAVEETQPPPAVESAVSRDLEPVSPGTADEDAARPDSPGLPAPPVGERGQVTPWSTLALTGDFAQDAGLARALASRLRAQAEAVDVIATGIEQLAETIA